MGGWTGGPGGIAPNGVPEIAVDNTLAVGTVSEVIIGTRRADP